MNKIFYKGLCAILALVCLISYGLDAQAAEGERATVVGYSKLKVTMSLAEPLGQAGQAQQLQQHIVQNLSFLPFATIIPSSAIPGGSNLPVASGPELDLKRFQLAGVDILITTRWVTNGQVELRAFQPFNGQNLFGNLYTLTGDNVVSVADKFCAQLLERLIGSGDFFRSSLAFVKTSGERKKDVWSVRPTGRDLRQLTNIRGEAISPSWSKDGRKVIFTSIEPRTHGLGIWDSVTNQTVRTQFPGNTVISPCFLPNGKVAVSLMDGNTPSIFLLNAAMQRESKLIYSSGIDVSPSIDASGTKVAFTSSRMGNPHVFLQDLRSGTVRRISSDGKYNSDPSISPDGSAIVYSRMMGYGHQLFVHEVASGKETQLTFGEGSNEQPEFAPDGYFIAFMSTRSGTKKIYLTTRYGGTVKEIPTGAGDASFPAWGLVDSK